MKKIVFILLLVLQNASAVQSKKSPVVTEIENAFQKVQTIQSDFDQTVRSSRFGEKKSKGTLILQRPGKMIWNYSLPKGRVFLADGKTITLYDPEDQQALVSSQPKGSDLPAGLSFLMGHSNLQDFFDVEVLKDQKNTRGNREVLLLCKPKKENIEFKLLELTFEWNPNVCLVASKTKDMLDSENEILFRNMKLNAKVDASDFHVKLPKNVPIVTVDTISP